MKITDIRKNAPTARWFSTEEVFGAIAPQPEIQLAPISWLKRGELTTQANIPRMVLNPDKPGEYLPYEQLDRFAFVRSLIHTSVVGLKHFEAADGKPLDAKQPADIDLLINEMPAEFVLWMQRLIIKISDEADELKKATQEKAAKNL